MASTAADILLARWLECADPAVAEQLLEELIVQHAQPGILKVVRYKLGFQGRGEQQDVEDVAGEVMAELIGRLQAIKDGTQEEKIASFSGYAAVAAYHGCHEYLRRKY